VFTCLVDLTVVTVAIPYLFSACAQLTYLVARQRPVQGWLVLAGIVLYAFVRAHRERVGQGPAPADLTAAVTSGETSEEQS
jgi:APA family basic amino acid/polyamine antiporter